VSGQHELDGDLSLRLVLPQEVLDGIVDAAAARIRAELDECEPGGAWPPWMDVATASRYLDVSEERLRKLIQRREVPFYQEAPRCRVLLKRTELDEWMSSFRQSASTPACRGRFN
jgi:excisionase family DNA binding protein